MAVGVPLSPTLSPQGARPQVGTAREFYLVLACSLICATCVGPAATERSADLSLPDVWGHGGALFAFSAFDGQTDITHPLVGSTLTTGRGFVFHTEARPELFVAALDEKGSPLSFIGADDSIVAGDVMSSRVTFAGGLAVKISFVFAANSVVLARLEADASVSGCRVGLRCGMEGKTTAKDRLLLREASGEWYAMAVSELPPGRVVGDGLFVELKERGDSAVFAWTFSAKSADEATSLARDAIREDLERLLQSRLRFFAGLPKPEGDEPVTKTYHKSCSVMKLNSCSAQGGISFPWTTPDRWPHKHMWIWDSGFHAIGLRHFAPEWAENAIKAVLSKQRDGGFVPHMLSVNRDEDSHIVQPPILSWCAWRTYETTRNRAFLEYCYPRLRDMLLYDCRELDRDRNGLSEWESGGASGMDNSPRFDQPLGDAVDFNSYICNDFRYLAKIAEALDKPQDARRWMNMRRDRAEKINRLLWDEDTGFYYDRLSDGRALKIKTAAGFTPMLAGVCDRRQAERLVARLKNPGEFWRAFPVATVSADERTFCDDMWRGPVWVNYNYIIIEGLREYGYHDLAGRLRQTTLSEVARWYQADGVIYEYFDSEGRTSPIKLRRKGKGGPDAKPGTEYLGTTICDYNWTAALFVDLLLDVSSQ